MRARARLNDGLDPRVVIGEHGWWQACAAIGAPGYDPFGPEGANLNLHHRRRGARSGQRHGIAPRLSVRDPPRRLSRHVTKNRCEAVRLGSPLSWATRLAPLPLPCGE